MLAYLSNTPSEKRFQFGCLPCGEDSERKSPPKPSRNDCWDVTSPKNGYQLSTITSNEPSIRQT
ncbi:hypothetical protein L207DRAFT_508443 [Hyaloscypha variabilis F]|uniref:Uncharacterized protein n=1 Tax=Hyaloscypha variabilis (strain UAMH 11265 / GT02V1 / F) TaxID=1149755 RepID=A0A2J6S4B9_HYAVF|nr:hypothetical protein L207DRAFT_508443 [Hyaloscypha variabilis F]